MVLGQIGIAIEANTQILAYSCSFAEVFRQESATASLMPFKMHFVSDLKYGLEALSEQQAWA